MNHEPSTTNHQPIKIGFDGNEANVDRRVGSGQYAFEILSYLVEVINQDQIAIYLKDQPRRDFPQPSLQVAYKIFGPKKLWTQFALPLRLYIQGHPDVFFSPAHYAPRLSPVPTVVTIHDLSYITFPDYFLKKDLEQLSRWTKYSINNAAYLITPSLSTKKDIEKYYQFPSERIAVIPHGYDVSRFHSQIDTTKVTITKQHYGIKSDYILYVGTLQPRKNVSRLIEAFAKIADQFPTINLLIVGKKGWLFDKVFTTINLSAIKNRIIFTDYVDDELLPLFYTGAKFYVLPSLYEGFGMPLLEAMACGTPVAASNVSSIPEVIGPGLMFNPANVDDIAQTLQKMLEMSDFDYGQLRQRSLEFVKQFSWEKAAKQTLDVLRQAVNGK